MANLRCVAAALLIILPSSLALKMQFAKQSTAPGAHLRNLGGETFDLKQPGEYVLLRAPREPTKNATIRVAGIFRAHDYAPCVPYLSEVTIHGDCLGSKMVHMAIWNGMLSIKVSSTNPTSAGPWRSVESFAAEPGESFPSTVHVAASPLPEALRTSKLTKKTEQPTFQFHVGPKDAKMRPIISITQGLQEGLDVSMSNMWGFENQTFAGLLSTEKHDPSLDGETEACGVQMQRTSKHYKGKHALTNWTAQPTRFRSLAQEDFAINRPGDFELLRVPKLKAEPAVIQARGTFLSADNVSCVVYLGTVTLSGEWLGQKVVHIRSSNGSFALKISSLDPPVAGMWRSIDTFTAAINGTEALPETVEVTTARGTPAFKFRVGPKDAPKRPSILVTQALHGGLEVSLSDMKSTGVPEIAGLLGTDKHDKAFDKRSADCEAGLRRLRDSPAGSSLTASWGL